MTKIRVEVTRTDVYTVDFDEKEWNAQDHIDISGKFDDMNEVAARLGYSIMQNGTIEPFHEGFGYVAMFKEGEQIKHQVFGDKLKAKDYTPGIIVHILEENESFTFNTEEIK